MIFGSQKAQKYAEKRRKYFCVFPLFLCDFFVFVIVSFAKIVLNCYTMQIIK